MRANQCCQVRCKVRCSPALHDATQHHPKSAQVVGNTGALHATLHSVAVRCVAPLSKGATQHATQRNGNRSHRGAAQPSAMGVGDAVATCSGAASRISGAAWWWLRPTGTSPGPSAGTGPAAPVRPRSKNSKIRATAQVGACSRPLPPYGLRFSRSAIFLLLFRKRYGLLPWGTCPAPWPGFGLRLGQGAGPLLCWWRTCGYVR